MVWLRDRSVFNLYVQGIEFQFQYGVIKSTPPYWIVVSPVEFQFQYGVIKSHTEGQKKNLTI